jgi:hypothetical protein
MGRLNGVFLLACVCVLLVVVSGAVESGKVTGFKYDGFSIVKVLGINLRVNSTTGTQGNSTGTSGALQIYLSHLVLPGFPLVLPAWLLAAVSIVCFGGACLLILRHKTTVRVLDIEDTLQEMEQQRKYLEETWSYRLRNAALLRYYLLMRRACLRVGLRDEPAETPQEYVGRVSSFFKVEKSEATEFASAVNRSRYGEELSELEAGEASRFMGAFADVIRRRASEGQ